MSNEQVVFKFIMPSDLRKKERKNDDAKLILASLTDFSDSMFQALESHFAPTN